MTQNNIMLRSVDHPQDYAQIATILNTVWPEPVSVDIMVEWMQRKPEGQVELWHVAVTPAGQIIGYTRASAKCCQRFVK